MADDKKVEDLKKPQATKESAKAVDSKKVVTKEVVTKEVVKTAPELAPKPDAIKAPVVNPKSVIKYK